MRDVQLADTQSQLYMVQRSDGNKDADLMRLDVKLALSNIEARRVARLERAQIQVRILFYLRICEQYETLGPIILTILKHVSLCQIFA